MGIDYILDTSNQHPKIKLGDQLEEFLVYYDLIISGVNFNDTKFIIHGLIWAKDSEDAFNKMPDTKHGERWTLMRGGVIGAVKDEERRNIHDRLHKIGGGIVLP